jgi:hypothetical protein
MKDKLRMLFAYFRGFKSQTVSTSILIDDADNEIFDWDQNYFFGPDKRYTPIQPINDTIEKLIKIYYDELTKYNTYDWDTLWSLDITISPFENKILFESECKQPHDIDIDKMFEIKDMNSTRKQPVLDFQSKVEATIIDIQFFGEYDSSEVTNLEFDNREKPINSPDWDEDDLLNVVDSIMTSFDSRYWNESGGYSGDIRIWGDDIILNCVKHDLEYSPTGLNLVVTPENVKDE